MRTLITCNETDDSGFIAGVGKILADKIYEFNPGELFITYVNNWFDSKWLKFSGTKLHEVSIWKLVEVTVPPFNPNRIIFSKTFIKTKNGFDLTNPDNQNLHVIQKSSANLNRKITDISQNGLFVWYSSNTKLNNKGSVLIYITGKDECITFNFDFSLGINSTWRVKKLVEQ